MFLRNITRRLFASEAKVIPSGSMIPKPLAIRMDSLLVQCMIAAAIYFVPQDAAILGLGLAYARASSRNVNPASSIELPDKNIESYLKSRGLESTNVTVNQGMRTWEVKLNTIFKN